MNDIKQKALALVNEIERERGEDELTPRIMHGLIMDEALCRAIELLEQGKAEHAERLLAMHSLMVKTEAERDATKQELADFKQKVSDAAQEATEIIDHWSGDRAGAKCLQDFIIPAPKPDPLVEALCEMDPDNMPNEADAENLRAALAARGFEIREKNDG